MQWPVEEIETLRRERVALLRVENWRSAPAA
jgi:hypothetical protein